MHDEITFCYLKHQKIFSLLACNYYWLKIKNIIYYYIQNCYPCKFTKVFQDKYNSLLKSLSIPLQFLTDVTLDFMSKLPPSNNYNLILMVIN